MDSTKEVLPVPGFDGIGVRRTPGERDILIAEIDRLRRVCIEYGAATGCPNADEMTPAKVAAFVQRLTTERDDALATKGAAVNFERDTAVLIEREACAKIADEHCDDPPSAVAAAIRARSI